MKKFWNLNSEARALIVSTLLLVIGVGGTAFLFCLGYYEIPFGVLVGGAVVALSWLALFLIKRSAKPHIKLDILFIYLRLGVIVVLATVFAVLAVIYGLRIISPISMILAYLVISIITMMVFIKKGE